MTLVWLGLAGALALFPGAGRAPGAARGDTPAVRRRSGPLVAGCAVAAACVALLGPLPGLPAAALAGPLTVAALRALARRPATPTADRGVALALDLAAAALRSGRPLGAALLLGAPAAEPGSAALLGRIGALTWLGAPPGEAWALVPDPHPLAPLAAAAVRSASSGIRLADAFERHAAELRVEAAARSAARAQRAGITAMGPLAACFLPSFVCLGVAPTVVGIATTVFGTLR